MLVPPTAAAWRALARDRIARHRLPLARRAIVREHQPRARPVRPAAAALSARLARAADGTKWEMLRRQLLRARVGDGDVVRAACAATRRRAGWARTWR